MNKIRKTDLDELREFAVRIQNQLNYTEVVVCNVVFKGSGNDNIYRHGVNVAVLSALIGRWIGLEKSKINLFIQHFFMILELLSLIKSIKENQILSWQKTIKK